VVCVLVYAILIAIFAASISLYNTSYADYALAFISVLYVIVFIVLLIKIRNITDAFYIKREFIALSIWVLVVVIAELVLSSIDKNEPQYDEIWGILLYLGTEIICIIFPLIMFFVHRRRVRSGKESNVETNAMEMSTTDLPVMSKIFEDDNLREDFMNFEAKHFSVNELLFILEVRKAKQKAKDAFPGQALLIYKKFIQPEAYLSLELPLTIANDIASIMNNEDRVTSGKVEQDIFDTAEEHVISVLEVDFKEFLKDQAYINFLKKQRIALGLNTIKVAEASNSGISSKDKVASKSSERSRSSEPSEKEPFNEDSH